MSDESQLITDPRNLNIIPFPNLDKSKFLEHSEEKSVSLTPTYDAIISQARALDSKSKYLCAFDFEIYKRLEMRYQNRKLRGGITFKSPFRLVNSHATCRQCLYAFEIDTYGRGCAHDCGYCYAKAELTVHGYWNNPIPAPVDINQIRHAFYTAFETDKNHKWKEILKSRVPLRIGSMSDSFMWLDHKIKVTQELLKILKFYDYPYIVFTRSDLVAHDDYINLLDQNLASIQFSISSTNNQLSKAIEPGAPSPSRRLAALRKLNEAGFWTTVRINPFFPIYPDGYFTDPNFKWTGEIPKFEFSSFEMIDEIASYKAPSVLAGFVRLSSFGINNIKKATGVDLRTFYRKDIVNKSHRDFHYSDSEIRYYYEQLKDRCRKKGVQFTTCYIGNGESHFWKDQDLWDNKSDCCNAKNRVSGFKRDCREIDHSVRAKLSNRPVDKSPESLAVEFQNRNESVNDRQV